MKGEQRRPQVKLCNVGFFRRQMSCRLNSFCSSSVELITYFEGIRRTTPFLVKCDVKRTIKISTNNNAYICPALCCKAQRVEMINVNK